MALTDFVKALHEAEEIELTVTGRVSSRKSTRPVWFVVDGETLCLLPVTGSDSEWYRNVLEHPTVTLAVDDVTWTAKAILITDPAAVHDVVEKFRAKYGPAEVKKYYSKFDVAVKIPLGRAGGGSSQKARKARAARTPRAR